MKRPVAVVTGGTGGIGSAICQRLSHDHQTIACYFKSGDHQSAAQWKLQQKSLGFEIETLFADLRKFNDCESLVALISERYGRIDVLVNNAGATCDLSLKKMQPQAWHQIIDANLTSVFNLTRNVLPLMLEQAHGRVINIASVNGRKGQFGQCNYAASKSALYGFSKSLALEVAKKGITVNTVSPGYTKTAMLDKINSEVLERIIAEIPIGRLGEPNEIASAVAFLASEEAGFITGANIDINGGQYM